MPTRQVLSINLSQLQPLNFNGQTIFTGIYKKAVDHPVAVQTLSIEGDRQADLINHGGALKAVYFYPTEHYAFWSEFLRVESLLPGAMGENFTCQGLLEDEAFVGDRWRIGSTVFEITQPRSPCYKLALKFQRADLVGKFLEAERPGFYASVIEEGTVSPGDTLTLESKARRRISVLDIYRLAVGFDPEPELRAAIVEHEEIPEFWRSKVYAHIMPSRVRT